jgi:hypothetical protein
VANFVGESALECAEEHAKLRKLRSDHGVPGENLAAGDTDERTAERLLLEQLLVRPAAESSKFLATHGSSDETVAALEGLADFARLAEAEQRSQLKRSADDDEPDTQSSKRIAIR